MTRELGRIIPIARPWMDESECEAVARVIATGWITQGPEIGAFERDFADYVGAPMPAPFPAVPQLCIWRYWPLASVRGMR